MGTAIKHPVPDRVRPSFVILTSGHSDAQSWVSECPGVKNYKWRLNPVWHRMLYSCTHMATVAFKGLIWDNRKHGADGRTDLVQHLTLPLGRAHNNAINCKLSSINNIRLPISCSLWYCHYLVPFCNLHIVSNTLHRQYFSCVGAALKTYINC